MQDSPLNVDDWPSIDDVPSIEPIIWIADLDPNDVLIGFKQSLRSEMPADAVEVPPNCDLACDGRYRFDREARTFVPRPAIVSRVGERAFARQLAAEAVAGIRSPDTLNEFARGLYEHMMR